MTVYSEARRAIARPGEATARRGSLSEPHVAPLADVCVSLRRQAPAGMPDFDPFDGGIDARLLGVLRSPAEGAKVSGFVSRDNNDACAANTCRVFEAAGIPRRETALWNIVPWYAQPPFRKPELELGARLLERVIAELPRLQVVVVFGRWAEKGTRLVRALPAGVRIVRTYSPGIQSRLSNPNYLDDIAADLRRAWELVRSGPSVDPSPRSEG